MERNGHDPRREPPPEGTEKAPADEPFAGWPDGRIDGYFQAQPPAVQWFCRDRLVLGGFASTSVQTKAPASARATSAVSRYAPSATV